MKETNYCKIKGSGPAICHELSVDQFGVRGGFIPARGDHQSAPDPVAKVKRQAVHSRGIFLGESITRVTIDGNQAVGVSF